ncbi:hypothetical protein NGF19_11090 [Streptomyces sp. RY43-2]|uniref:Uncharacterized protein n=1 Tax=Streptomyces macrolidinus TaxID=2952607 RepID=A0ABT0ZC19_9ACTN|nr:hypothetical protein [Streptomyces macrolidinus]MCN9241327.1 hypothetical protein [Streptomyces macrolidinus]
MAANAYFEDIVDWYHHRAGRAHTLVRAVYDPATRRAVAIVSELASNPDDRGITDDFAGVADAVLPTLRQAFGSDLSRVEWIAHFGEFSYHDPAGPETFTRIALTTGEAGHRDDLSGDQPLTTSDVEKLFQGLRLQPVNEVLARIGHGGAGDM